MNVEVHMFFNKYFTVLVAAAAPPHVHVGGPGLRPAIVSAVPRPKTKGRLLRHLLRERPGLLKRLLRRKRLRKAQRVVPVLPTVPGKSLMKEDQGPRGHYSPITPSRIKSSYNG